MKLPERCDSVDVFEYQHRLIEYQAWLSKQALCGELGMLVCALIFVVLLLVPMAM